MNLMKNINFSCLFLLLSILILSEASSVLILPPPVLVSRQATSIVLRWPPKEQSKIVNALKQGMDRFVCKVSSAKKWQKKAKIINGHPHNYEIAHLRKGTSYICRVSISHHSGKMYSPSIPVETRNVMFAPPPSYFRVESSGSPLPYIQAVWKDPVGFEGDIHRFVVNVQEKSTNKTSFDMTVDGKKHSVLIKTVKPFTHYLIKVRADTIKSQGFFTKAIAVFTKTGLFTPPVGFCALKVKDHSALLRWNMSVGKNGAKAESYLLKCLGTVKHDKKGKIASVVDGYPLTAAGADAYENNGGRLLKFQINNLQAYTTYSCTLQARGPAGLGKKTRKLLFQTKTTAPPLPKKPDLISTSTQPVFRLQPASDRHGPISHYNLIVIPRAVHPSGHPYPIKDPSDVYLAQAVPKDSQAAAASHRPCPYVAHHFKAGDLPSVVALVSPSWNASVEGRKMIHVLWNMLHVSLSLRAFVESTDPAEPGEFFSSSPFSKVVFIGDADNGTGNGSDDGNSSFLTVMILAGLILTLVSAAVASLLCTACKGKCRKRRDEFVLRGERSPRLGDVPAISSSLYGHVDMSGGRSSQGGIIGRISRLFSSEKRRDLAVKYTSLPTENLSEGEEPQNEIVIYEQKVEEKSNKASKSHTRRLKRPEENLSSQRNNLLMPGFLSPEPSWDNTNNELTKEKGWNEASLKVGDGDEEYLSFREESLSECDSRGSIAVSNRRFSHWSAYEDLSGIKDEMDVEISSSSDDDT